MKKKVAFTTHTPVPAGHDKFDYDLVKDVFRDTLPPNIRELGGKDNLNMTVLALNLSSYINGVAKKHGDISRKMFPDYDIDYITNGIHLGYWVSKPIKDIFDKKWPNWKSKPEVLKNAIEIDDLDLFDAHLENKYKLITTHTARRSFATNLYLAGVQTHTIMAITGHSTEKAFLRYIKVTPDQHARILQRHWKNQLKIAK